MRLAGLTPSLTLDTRDNMFTPTRGAYLDLAAQTYRESLGSDRDFELLQLLAMTFVPLDGRWPLGMKAGARTASDETPFYLRPYVMLRGVQAVRYQGKRVAELETELRWQWRPRWSLVGFAGVGESGTDRGDRTKTETVTAGGLGFRYLVARSHGLHMGLDVAWGPDDPAIYVVFGSAWMRP